MDKAEVVRKMQVYIENHLSEKITLGDLAKVSYYSPWHSYRIFIEVLQISPSDYIRRLKLSKSALELRNEKKKIIEIAYKYGYDSVDGYQRAFFKEFGTNPYEYSQNPIPIYLFTPYKKYYTEEKKKMQDVKNIFISIIEKPSRKIILKRGIKATNYFDYCSEVGCDVWGILTSIKSISNEPVCLWLPEECVKERTSIYVQGVEVSFDYSGIIPEGFDIIDLPETTYLMFNGEPFAEKDYGTAIEEVWSAIKKYNPKNLSYDWDEKNPRIQLEPLGSRGYIELKAVKKINSI